MEKEKKEYPKLKKLDDIKYTGPKKTFTQELSKEEINQLLDGYEETTFSNLNKGFHVRYFKKVNGMLEFKMGGTILKKEAEYVILTNGMANWSVQKVDTVFYQHETIIEIRKQLDKKYGDEIDGLKKRNDELISYVKLLKIQLVDKDKLIEKLENKIKKK